MICGGAEGEPAVRRLGATAGEMCHESGRFSDVAGILTRVIAAVVILVVTWLIAKLIKTVLSKALTKVKVLQREDASGHSLGESLATIASLVVWLFGLLAILNLFALTEVVAPIQGLLQGVLAALPGIAGAALIFFIGLVLARIVRQLVETSLRAAGADSWLQRGEGATADATHTTGTRATSTTPPLSRIAGQLVFALILIVVSISALQVLGIEAIADPATQMLTLILNADPVGDRGGAAAGDRLPDLAVRGTAAGVDPAGARHRSRPRRPGAGGTTSTPPSSVIAKIAQVAIVLFFAVAATRVLGFPEVTAILDTVLEVAGGIILGGVIIAVGVFVANLAPRFVSGRAGEVGPGGRPSRCSSRSVSGRWVWPTRSSTSPSGRSWSVAQRQRHSPSASAVGTPPPGSSRGSRRRPARDTATSAGSGTTSS